MPNRSKDELYLPNLHSDKSAKTPSPDSVDNFKRIERWANALNLQGGSAEVVYWGGIAGDNTAVGDPFPEPVEFINVGGFSYAAGILTVPGDTIYQLSIDFDVQATSAPTGHVELPWAINGPAFSNSFVDVSGSYYLSQNYSNGYPSSSFVAILSGSNETDQTLFCTKYITVWGVLAT